MVIKTRWQIFNKFTDIETKEKKSCVIIVWDKHPKCINYKHLLVNLNPSIMDTMHTLRQAKFPEKNLAFNKTTESYNNTIIQ